MILPSLYVLIFFHRYVYVFPYLLFYVEYSINSTQPKLAMLSAVYSYLSFITFTK